MLKKTRPPDVKRLITYMVIGVIAYAVMVGMGRIEGPKPQHTGSGTPQPASKIIGDTVQRLARGMQPPYEAKETKEGTGLPAICGQEAQLSATLEWLDEQGTPTRLEDNAPLTFRLGDNTQPPGLLRAVLGMKPGAERVVTLAPELAFDAPVRARDAIPKGSRVRYTLALKSLTPAIPESDLKLKRFDETIGERGFPAECGSEVKLRLAVYDSKGKKRFDSSTEKDAAPLTFTVGFSAMPVGLEQGIMGLNIAGKRTLLIPPAYQRPLWPGKIKAPANWPFPMNETAIVEIERVP